MSDSWSSEPGPVVEQPPHPEQRVRALQRVRAPAIGLLVTAGLGFLVAIAAALFLNRVLIEAFDLPPELREQMEASQSPVLTAVQLVVTVVVCGLVVWGALGMLKLKSWGLAIAASFLALLPCVSPCCLIGLPFGIWALVVLFDKDVKAAFS
jgi:hypothetical protein